MPLCFTAIGLGDLQHLTPAARRSLEEATVIYVMAGEKSWMVGFLEELGLTASVRRFYPQTVAWGEWLDDPVFTTVADEIAVALAEEASVAVVTAGDVSTYGNVTPLVPLLRERGISWSVLPGISFLSAYTMVTGEPLVGEGDSLLVTRLSNARELDSIFTMTNRVALYDPQHTQGLVDYVRAGGVSYAVSAMAGVAGGQSSTADLLNDENPRVRGIALLHAGKGGNAGVSELSRHFGPNGWDAQGRFFAVSYPDELVRSDNGRPDTVIHAFRFPDQPTDVRGFFIDREDRIFVSLKGYRKAPFGRTYRSEDGGRTFQMVLERCCWTFDEDRAGNLYCGVYHENGEPDAECALYRSQDGGRSWVDIAPADWRSQLHVHHLAVDPATGWLYAALGDAETLRGCWRTTEPAAAEPKWVHKIHAGGAAQQFTGIAFLDGDIYLADDNGPGRNPGNTLVYRARDDGSEEPTTCVSCLTAPGDGWGAFFLEKDRKGDMWVGCRPVGGKGAVWRTSDGREWHRVATTLDEDLPCWRGTHTFRDCSIGETGSGRNLAHPSGGIVTSYLNRALRLF